MPSGGAGGDRTEHFARRIDDDAAGGAVDDHHQPADGRREIGTPNTAGSSSDRAIMAVCPSAPPMPDAKPAISPGPLGPYCRGNFGCDDTAAGGRHLEGLIGRFRQAADDPSADIAYVLHAGGHIGVVEFGEAANDLRNLRLNGGFGVSAVLLDALLDAPDEARTGQHLHVRVEEEAELVGNGRRQFPRLGSQGFDLIPEFDCGLKARDLAIDLFTLDAIFRHVEGTA